MKTSLTKWSVSALAIFVLALFFIGCAPAIVTRLGYPYLGSTEWVVQSRIPAYVAGAILAGCFIFAAVIKLRSSETIWEKFKSFVLLVFCVPFGAYIGAAAVTMGVPMIAAAVAGSETQITYTVLENTERDRRKCRWPITLESLPFSFDELCGFPEDFRKSFEVGDKIAVNGKGTSLGIFVETARRTR